jgi:hypothetical protein
MTLISNFFAKQWHFLFNKHIAIMHKKSVVGSLLSNGIFYSKNI